MQWKNGRQLSQITTSNDTVTFKYNANGLRTRKDDSNYTTYYYYDDNNNLIAMMQGGVVAYYYYDSDNSVTAMSLNDTMYYYIKNLQGDITKIVNESGNVLVEYTYDAWGKILNETSSGNGTYAHVKDFNPFRYRGYVYDTDTGLYYLQSRYYDPQTGRFINADVYCDTQTGSSLSTNMFAYCENNPVNYVDCTGCVIKYFLFKKLDITFGKRMRTSKEFYCFLTNEWAKCSKYTKSKTITIGATVSGEISASFKDLVSAAAGGSLSCQVGLQIGQEIPANPKKYSKLAVYLCYYTKNVTLKVYQLKFKRIKFLIFSAFVPYYSYKLTQKGKIKWPDINNIFIEVYYK